jgi:hypothetical protein
MKSVAQRKGEYRFASTLERSDNKLWGCHFRVPARIAKWLVDSKSRRVVCSLNGRAEYQCAIQTFGRGVKVITVNKKLRDTLGLSYGMEVHVVLRRDTSTYGLPLPEEFQELLRQDPEGDRLFHALTRGKQRTLLYIVGSVKDSEKRTGQAITIIRHLKTNNGKINYRQLGAMLKDPRGQ